ncbi:MAG: hypothetical protein V1787_04360 [Candidatus Micrarchaeota archaeon]
MSFINKLSIVFAVVAAVIEGWIVQNEFFGQNLTGNPLMTYVPLLGSFGTALLCAATAYGLSRRRKWAFNTGVAAAAISILAFLYHVYFFSVEFLGPDGKPFINGVELAIALWPFFVLPLIFVVLLSLQRNELTD